MSKFFNEEKYKTIFIVVISCLLNIIKINGLSFISANIIKSIEKSIINILLLSLLYLYYCLIITKFYKMVYYQNFDNG